MDEKILKVKEAIVDLLQSYPDISSVDVFINEDTAYERSVTVSVDILAKLVDNED